MKSAIPFVSRVRQRGGVIMGIIVGLLVGLIIALGVAMYVTKMPMPFVDNKTGNRRTPEQEAAEAERLRHWDPNAGLAGRAARAIQEGASLPSSPAVATATPAASAGSVATPARPILMPSSTRDPAAILAGRDPLTAPERTSPPEPPPRPTPAPAPSPAPATNPPNQMVPVYQVQIGAFSTASEAEQQRARLATQGYDAKIYEREINGRTVFRVRIGPFSTREEADQLRERLQSSGSSSIVTRSSP